MKRLSCSDRTFWLAWRTRLRIPTRHYKLDYCACFDLRMASILEAGVARVGSASCPTSIEDECEPANWSGCMHPLLS